MIDTDRAIDHCESRALDDNGPLWNFSSMGGTILRTLVKRTFVEVVTW